MNERDKKKTIELYEERYKSYGYDIRTVGWRDWPQQELRFRILTEPFDLNGKSVLDVGCGFGDLYNYLKKHFRLVKYTGVDIAPSLIKDAKKRHPGARFAVTDILKGDCKDRYDYIFLSGAFNHRISNNIVFAKKMIKKMFEISREGIAFNMLSTYVDYTKPINYHYSPEEFFGYAKTLSRFVNLKHDYPLWEFTIHIIKRS